MLVFLCQQLQKVRNLKIEICVEGGGGICRSTVSFVNAFPSVESFTWQKGIKCTHYNIWPKNPPDKEKCEQKLLIDLESNETHQQKACSVEVFIIMYVLVVITKKSYLRHRMWLCEDLLCGRTSSFWIWENVFKDPSSTVHDCLLTWNFSATFEQIPLHTFTLRFDVNFFAKNEVRV